MPTGPTRLRRLHTCGRLLPTAAVLAAASMAWLLVAVPLLSSGSSPCAFDFHLLHFFAGMTLDETAESLGISRATTYRHWAYARALLRLSLQDGDGDGDA